MINEKKLFIQKLQPNVIKLECANREIFIFEGICFVRLSYMDENRSSLITHIDNVLYSLQAHFNLMLFGQLSKKGIDFKTIRDKITLHHLEKTIVTKV